MIFVSSSAFYAQGVGINKIDPQATLHIGGGLKFNPDTTTNATRLIAVTDTGEVSHFPLGDNFIIVDGTLKVNEEVDENTFLVGDQDQTATANSGQYDNYAIGLQQNNANNTIIRFSGETSNYTITGFANAYHGRIFYLYNAQTVNVTFTNLDAASSPENQILTGNGANIGISAEGVAEFIYDGVREKWILINIRN